MVTMNNYWEVDIGFQNPQKNLTWMTLKGHFIVMKVKVAHVVLTVAPRPRMHMRKMFIIAQLIKVHFDL